MTFTIRLRSIIWFATGALVALLVGWVVMSAWSAEAAPGDSDTTTVPITACRLVDTRPESQVGPRDTPLAAEDTYTVKTQDASTDCAGKVPAEATGLVLNVTAARTTAATFVTVWDSGPWPGTSSMNPVPGPPVPNAVTTKLAGDDTFRIYNYAGSTHVVVDVVAYLTPSSLTELADQVTALQSDLAALEAQVAASQPVQIDDRLAVVEGKTASMTTEAVDGQPTIRFSGVNVQIVDGSGDTDGAVNGRGNLIVGYNRDLNGNDTRTGSHNLVVGDDHTYDSYGGFLAGLNNRVSAAWASVSGGGGNVALADYSSVSGGENNTATAPFASVAGGIDNDATGDHSAVLGGDRNTASGSQATVSGGGGNIASGGESSVAGGNVNEAAGSNTVVSGGRFNDANPSYSSISGGENNLTGAGGIASSVSGGRFNFAADDWASVSGGRSNIASGGYSSVSGGQSNRVADEGSYSSIAGGRNNLIFGAWSSITGGGGPNSELGDGNQVNGDYATIAGGNYNLALGENSAISGGLDNQTEAGASASTVSGGRDRTTVGFGDWRAGDLFQED